MAKEEEVGQITQVVFASPDMMKCIAKYVRSRLCEYNIYMRNDEIEELVRDMHKEVLNASLSYNRQKSNPYSFACVIVGKKMSNWRKCKIQYDNTFEPMTEKVMRSATPRFNASAYDEQRRAAVRRTVRRLSPNAQILCQLIMECGVDQARETLKMSKYEFYEKVWPACQSEFKRIYAEEWV